MYDATLSLAIEFTNAERADENMKELYALDRALDHAANAYWQNRQPQVPAIGTLRTVAYYSESGDWFGTETLRVVSTAFFPLYGETTVTCERLHPYDGEPNGTTLFGDLWSFWNLTI